MLAVLKGQDHTVGTKTVALAARLEPGRRYLYRAKRNATVTRQHIVNNKSQASADVLMAGWLLSEVFLIFRFQTGFAADFSYGLLKRGSGPLGYDAAFCGV
jgi:hypothetical protein